ncbi:hypothetical protein CHU93_15100 [Sandarakinorhabdus cyanobacteriorum]|uniref:Uncharacterized protein n=1 Tax=Sandarakinorhabdus cyanobacteriorum TaxID=1981098 RepID=A0A255Y666_9SPHN|nr:hypothetical protein [Sandarakinorhabdus cyanobacteriorum]OYQ24688.1 hypothetical protein CHU93_15100 [Sandarakinorhabdus cyanobacteriorum]
MAMTTPPSRFAGRDPAELRAHLARYWKMEAGNVLAVPLLVWFLVWNAGDQPDLAAGLAAAACAVLLVIGTAAWRLVLARLDGRADAANGLLAFCARAEIPALLLLVVASIATGLAIAANGWPPRTIAAAGLTLLAWLEYVNYYHWQLQNFDSAIDFKRLLAGRGLRRAHMGKAVRAWRRARRQ